MNNWKKFINIETKEPAEFLSIFFDETHLILSYKIDMGRIKLIFDYPYCFRVKDDNKFTNPDKTVKEIQNKENSPFVKVYNESKFLDTFNIESSNLYKHENLVHIKILAINSIVELITIQHEDDPVLIVES